MTYERFEAGQRIRDRITHVEAEVLQANLAKIFGVCATLGEGVLEII